MSRHYYVLKMIDGLFHIFVRKQILNPVQIEDLAVFADEESAKELADSLNKYYEELEVEEGE